MENKQLSNVEKQMKIAELYPELMRFPNLFKYFDLFSDKLLDEKLLVLQSLAEGKEIKDIEGFYEIFELLPKDAKWD